MSANTVILSFWLLNPLTHQYEWQEQARYPTPEACAQEARSAMKLEPYITWQCVYYDINKNISNTPTKPKPR